MAPAAAQLFNARPVKCKPETLGPAFQEMVSPFLPPEEGWVENILFPIWPVVPNFQKSSFLCDSVHPVSFQVQGHSVQYCAEPTSSRLLGGDHGPTGEGCDRASLQQIWSQGFKTPTAFYIRNGGGLEQSWTCVSCVGPLTSSRSRC